MSAPREGTTERIVVGVDGSGPSVAALRWAVRQAEITGATLDAVISWQFPLAEGGLGWAPVGGVDNTDYRELATTSLAKAVAEVSPPSGLTVHQHIVEGSPAQVLLDAAAGADLLVVGNRGHNEFEDALIGSVGIRCLHHASCPVVVVHGPKHHR